MRVTVVWAGDGLQDLVPLDVEPGATAADALERSGLAATHGFDADRSTLAIFGRRVPAASKLTEGDRVEVTGPLVADPKEARRHRARDEAAPRPSRAMKRAPP
jgi:putative ubiquitin-RnfH superfamily antitoxin RatB of RatAB toxin-antitoxin module